MSKKNRAGYAILGAVCVFVLGFYAWTARPGVWQMAVSKESDPTASDPANAYYNLLVQGFRSGQLNLKREVPPGLTKLADPYDPVANYTYRTEGLHDTSYYQGKLYLYFGVTPAMVLFWPYAILTGHYLFHKEAVAVFCAVGFLVSVALLCAFWRRYFPEVSGAVVAACAFALGLATCVPMMLQRPDVYEVPISCAYAMVMLALAGIWRALHDPARRFRWLAAASFAYGLAVGARPNVLFGAVIMLAPVVHSWISASERDGPRWFIAARLLAAAVVPISLVGFGLMLYNYLRFDGPFEFGQHYQLSGNRLHETQHFFGLNYLWFNFRAYFLQPIHWSSSFPFVDSPQMPPAPAGYLGAEEPFDALPNIPFVWMALAVPLTWRKRTENGRLFVAATALLFGITALTVCLIAGSALRYQVDFMPALIMLAVCGVLGLEHSLVARPRWRVLARCSWIAALFFSVAISLLASVHFYAISNAFAHLHKGEALARIPGRLPAAITEFEAALRVNPDFADAHYNLGTALLKMPGRLPDAMAQFQAALRINPDLVDAHYNLGTLLLKMPGRLPDAMAQFQAALRLKPDYAKAYQNLGVILDQEGRIEEAINDYTQAIRLDSNLVDAHYNLAVDLQRTGRLAAAIDQYREIVRATPDDFPAQCGLGSALAQQGRLAEAHAQFEETVRIFPESAEARYNLGNILVQLGRLPEAAEQYELALRYKPDFPAARNNLELTRKMMAQPADGPKN